MKLRVHDTTELLALIEDYLSKAKIGATKFGWLATNDLSFVSKLRHRPNYDPSMSTVTRVLDFLEQATQVETEEDVADGL